MCACVCETCQMLICCWQKAPFWCVESSPCVEPDTGPYCTWQALHGSEQPGGPAGGHRLLLAFWPSPIGGRGDVWEATDRNSSHLYTHRNAAAGCCFCHPQAAPAPKLGPARHGAEECGCPWNGCCGEPPAIHSGGRPALPDGLAVSAGRRPQQAVVIERRRWWRPLEAGLCPDACPGVDGLADGDCCQAAHDGSRIVLARLCLRLQA